MGARGGDDPRVIVQRGIIEGITGAQRCCTHKGGRNILSKKIN